MLSRLVFIRPFKCTRILFSKDRTTLTVFRPFVVGISYTSWHDTKSFADVGILLLETGYLNFPLVDPILAMFIGRSNFTYRIWLARVYI